MKCQNIRIRLIAAWLMLCFCGAALGENDREPSTSQWQTLATKNQPTARHEAAFVAYKGKLYLIGGRRINPVDVFDPKTGTWEAKSSTPIELHHFQAVALGDAIYLVGAMTGAYPNETPLPHVIAYYPERDRFESLHEIPEARRRGGAGAVAYEGKIYIVGGIVNGHVDGSKPWLDEYDPSTGRWRVLPDAQFARDHVQAAVLKDRLYVFGGRTSRQRTNQVLELLTEHGEIFDFGRERWQPVTRALALPTLRAGHMLMAWGDEIVVAGGESHTQVPAHAEADAYNVATGQWRRWPALVQGRHGSGLAIVDGAVYTASGAGNRGGGPELTTVEHLALPTPSKPAKRPKQTSVSMSAADSTPVIARWHTLTLDFQGPQTRETAHENPFTHYRLLVEFKHADRRYLVRGFYAADGDAANSGADAGDRWRVRFTPDLEGEWTYRASLRYGPDIAIDDAPDLGTAVRIANPSGRFQVTRSDKDGVDFRAHGRLQVDNGYFKFQDADRYWLKVGTNSPENLLGFADFDGTYRVGDQNREGEARPGEGLHAYAAHASDWRPGDPTWRGGKGKSLIGAINYLASTGMNAAYFLTMNIDGDGKDVWPYIDHRDFTRFDCSKLEQWEIVFAHMQSKGILLHLVTQERENERLLDDGDVGRLRKLYYRELIARFGHHLGLVWNLGEENGPVSWSPIAQSDAQRKAMAQAFERMDPYGHPVLLHTHSTAEDKDKLLTPLLGETGLDGLSFQVDKRERVHDELIEWRAAAAKTGHPWLITMDEIGEWHSGALPDAVDPDHDTLRRYALWGALLAGGAGVEWYFGAKHPANDLTSEDWRMRARLWAQTRYAHTFFTAYLPYWRMHPAQALVNAADAYVFAEPGAIYAIYLPAPSAVNLDLRNRPGKYSVRWYDPFTGGDLQQGEIAQLNGDALRLLGLPPASQQRQRPAQDWVVLVRREADTASQATQPERQSKTRSGRR
jgi:hypothetical protein